jgi:hypothetical protein
MIEQVILSTLVILGVWHITQEDYPLHFVRRFLDRVGMIRFDAPYADEAKTWYYPVLYCVRCMSSVWGAALFFILPNTPDVWLLPFHVLAVFGLVWVVSNAEVDE